MRIHVHRLASIAPAGSHRDGNGHIFGPEFLDASGTFGHTTDGRIGNNTLDRRSVGIFKRSGKQPGNAAGHLHGLVFKRFAHTVHTSVDRGANPDFGPHPLKSVSYHIVVSFSSVVL